MGEIEFVLDDLHHHLVMSRGGVSSQKWVCLHVHIHLSIKLFLKKRKKEKKVGMGVPLMTQNFDPSIY
jgi:hypothetical protein